MNLKAQPTYWTVIQKALLILFALPTLALSVANAQIPTDFNKGGSQYGNSKSNQNNNENEEEEGPDTTIYKFYYLSDINLTYDYADTLADRKFLHIDPLMVDGYEYINTGNRGSATFPLIFRYRPNVGFHLGYDQYQPYRITPENMKFYEQNRPLSQILFSQQGSQTNINTTVQFSRNFSDGFSFSLDYNRIGHLGFYANQKVSMTNLGIGLRYQSATDRFNSFVVYTRNANSEAINGGVRDINFSEQFTNNATVFLNEANVRHKEQTFSWVNFLRLNKSKGSSWSLRLKNDISYRPSYYKMADKTLDNGSDSLFYKELLIDPRGIRRYTKVNHFKNTFSVTGGKKNGIQAELGLSLDQYGITENNDASSRTDATLLFKGDLPLFKALKVRTEGKLGLLANIGNFYGKGEVQIGLSKWANLLGGLTIFRGEQSRNALRLYLNEQNVFDHKYEKTFGTIINAKLEIPKLNLAFNLNQSLINNIVYWGQDGLPLQKDGTYSHTYLGVSNQLKLGRIRLDQAYHVQVQSNDILPLPKSYSTHQLYFNAILFRRVMNLNTGIDLRFIYDYKGPGYQPVFGTFHLTDTNLPFYPAVNYFIMAKVSEFRINLSIENVSKYFVAERNYDVVNNPQFDNKFRITISWLLKD